MRTMLFCIFAMCSTTAMAQESSESTDKSDSKAGSKSFEMFASLEGDWIDVDGTMGMKDEVSVTYRLTGGGSAVVETLFPGKPQEMVSVYHRDGDDLMMTHYCMLGNQPRMRCKSYSGKVVEMQFDGGANIDPAKDKHMHAGRFEFVNKDELKSKWVGWAEGKPNDHTAEFRVVRKK